MNLEITRFIFTDLGREFFLAHQKCAERMNVSSVAVMNTHGGNGANPFASIASSLLSVGGAHAPIIHAHYLYGLDPEDSELENHINNIIESGGKIPGLGSSFDDDYWWEFDERLSKDRNEKYLNAIAICDYCNERLNKKLKPNAAFYTAVVGLMLDLHPMELPQLFIIPRLQVWSEIMKGHIPWQTKES